MNEKISIIVPVYNAEKTLKRCVESLISQTYKNTEIILVNDGSKDNSLDICRKFESQDKRIRVIDQANGGVSSARNAGLDNATGEFVMFCDSDDWAEPNWCMELITHYENGCLIMCGHFVEGEQSYLPYEICAQNKIERYSRREIRKLKLKFFSAPWNKIFNRNVIEDNGIRFDLNITNGEDYLFNMQYLNSIDGDIFCLSKCVFHYVWPSGNNLSVRINEKYFTECELWTQKVCCEAEKMSDGDLNYMRFFYTEAFNRFQKGLVDVAKDSTMPRCEKIRRMDGVMKNDIYQKCVYNADNLSNGIGFHLWKMKKCYGIYLWICLKTLIRKL